MRYKIALIDDSKSEETMLRYIINKNHLKIDIDYYSCTKKALKALTQVNVRHSLKCILIDYDMPEMNGLESLVHIRKEPLLKSIPLILVSNSIDPDIIKDCLSQGANAYILKPSSSQGQLEFLQSIETFWCKFNYY